MMKYEMMMKAWEKIQPDSIADARMRANILAYQRSCRRMHSMAWKKYVSLAARLVLIAGACLGVRYFGTARYSVTLNSGESLVYTESDTPLMKDSMIAPYPVKSRELTPDEISRLFPETNKTENDYMFAFFKEETGEAVHLEGRIGDIKLNAAKNGVPLTDTILEGTEQTGTLCGIPIKTGVAFMRSRTVIFYAEYRTDELAVRAELAGDAKDGHTIGITLSEAVYAMIKNGEPDFSKLHYE